MKNLKKTVLLFLLFAGIMESAMAQIRVVTDFNSVISGRSINVLVSGQVKNRHEFGGGLRININKDAHNDDQGNIYKKRMYATEPLHYFGLEGFYQIHFLQRLPHIDLFAFYDVQVCYSTTGNRLLPAEEEMAHFGPFTWLEQNIGIGFSVDIWDNVFLTQRLGGGMTFILGEDNPKNEVRDDYLMKDAFDYEFGYLFSAGIGYRFAPKKK